MSCVKGSTQEDSLEEVKGAAEVGSCGREVMLRYASQREKDQVGHFEEAVGSVKKQEPASRECALSERPYTSAIAAFLVRDSRLCQRLNDF